MQPSDKRITVITVLLAINVGCSLLTAFSTFRTGSSVEPTQIHWEHRVEGLADREFEKQANSLGADGWEIVTARRAVDSNDESLYEVILKRRVDRKQ